MALDPAVNFGKVEVSTGYAAGATSIVLSSGEGAKLPDPAVAGDYNLVWWDSDNYPDPSDDPNVEIVRVTAKTGDTLTVTRAQESTSDTNKNTGGATYKMHLGPTAKFRDDANSIFGQLAENEIITGAWAVADDTYFSVGNDLDGGFAFISADNVVRYTGVPFEFGVDAAGVQVDLFTTSAGHGMTWDPDAGVDSPKMEYRARPHKIHWLFDASLSTQPSGSSFFSLIKGTPSFTYTGTNMVGIVMDFEMTDSRILNGGSFDFFRPFSLKVNRTSTFKTTDTNTYGLQPLYMSPIDAGTYETPDGETGRFTPTYGIIYQEYNLAPKLGEETASDVPATVKSVPISAIDMNGQISITDNTVNKPYQMEVSGIYVHYTSVYGNDKIKKYGLRYEPSIIEFNSPSVHEVYGVYYNPAFPVAIGGRTKEYSHYAGRSGIALASDATSGTDDDGGTFRQGLSEDWERWWHASNHAYENIPTGGDYIFQINGADEITFAADALTFNNGATDSGFGWATSGQLDFTIGGSIEMSLQANTLTFEAGATDPVLDWSVSGVLDVSTGDLKVSNNLEIDGDLNHDGNNVGFFGVAPAAQAAAYTPTNVSTDRSYDADSTTLDEIADVLGTLIADLQSYGLLQ